MRQLIGCFLCCACSSVYITSNEDGGVVGVSTGGSSTIDTRPSTIAQTGGQTSASTGGSTGGQTSASTGGSSTIDTRPSTIAQTGGQTSASTGGSTGGQTSVSIDSSTGGQTCKSTMSESCSNGSTVVTVSDYVAIQCHGSVYWCTSSGSCTLGVDQTDKFVCASTCNLAIACTQTYSCSTKVVSYTRNCSCGSTGVSCIGR